MVKNSKSKEFVGGSSVRCIQKSAFEGCAGLTGIAIPDSMREIRECAFRGCTNLINITIPDGLTEIGLHAFFGCQGKP